MKNYRLTFGKLSTIFLIVFIFLYHETTACQNNFIKKPFFDKANSKQSTSETSSLDNSFCIVDLMTTDDSKSTRKLEPYVFSTFGANDTLYTQKQMWSLIFRYLQELQLPIWFISSKLLEKDFKTIAQEEFEKICGNTIDSFINLEKDTLFKRTNKQKINNRKCSSGKFLGVIIIQHATQSLQEFIQKHSQFLILDEKSTWYIGNKYLIGSLFQEYNYITCNCSNCKKNSGQYQPLCINSIIHNMCGPFYMIKPLDSGSTIILDRYNLGEIFPFFDNEKENFEQTRTLSKDSKRLLTEINKKNLISKNENLLNEILMAHIFKDTIQESLWLKKRNFSPRGWAANYSFLYFLFRILNDVNPSSIIEFGVGETSKLTAQYTEYFQKASLILVEHDAKWVETIKKEIPDCSNIKLLNLELEPVIYNNYETTGYKGLKNAIYGKFFNLIIVDGPPGKAHYSRISVLDIVPDFLDKSFVIIMDDLHRIGEQETALEIFKKLQAAGIDYNFSIKGELRIQLLIYSPDLNFLKFL